MLSDPAGVAMPDPQTWQTRRAEQYLFTMSDRPQVQASPGTAGEGFQVNLLGVSAGAVVSPQHAIQWTGPHVAVGTDGRFMEPVRCGSNIVAEESRCCHVAPTTGRQEPFFRSV